MFRRGAGSVGYWRDWPGEWHCPVILKLTTEAGGRMPPINLVLGLAALRPTEVGGTVGGLSPRRRVVSLPLPPPLDMHFCQWASWQECTIYSFHSFILLHLTPSFRFSVQSFSVWCYNSQSRCLNELRFFLVFIFVNSDLEVSMSWLYNLWACILCLFRVLNFNILLPWDWDLYLDLCIICALYNLTSTFLWLS